jgi:hypothetical protein
MRNWFFFFFFFLGGGGGGGREGAGYKKKFGGNWERPRSSPIPLNLSLNPASNESLWWRCLINFFSVNFLFEW